MEYQKKSPIPNCRLNISWFFENVIFIVLNYLKYEIVISQCSELGVVIKSEQKVLYNELVELLQWCFKKTDIQYITFSVMR